MARTLGDLIDAGALSYAQSRLTRGDTLTEVLDKLARRYPQYQPALLSSVLEIAQAEERAKAEIAAAGPGQVFGPDQIPFIPGLPAGQYSIDFTLTGYGRNDLAGHKLFLRMDFDKTDIAVANLIIASGQLAPVPGRWQALRDLLANAPADATVADVAAVSGDVIAKAAAKGPAAGAPAVSTGLTKEAIDIIMTNLPLDEGADIIFPANKWQKYEFQRIADALVKSLVRG